MATEKRWGNREDLAMIATLPDAEDRDSSENPVHWFQRIRGLEVDDIAGSETRHALIRESRQGHVFRNADIAVNPPWKSDLEAAPSLHGTTRVSIRPDLQQEASLVDKRTSGTCQTKRWPIVGFNDERVPVRGVRSHG